MPIRFQCPRCEASLRVPDHQAGKRGKCPKCSTPITIENPNAQASPQEADDTTYDLAGSSARKVLKAIKVREGALPPQGVASSGVAEAAAPTRKTLSPRQILSAFHEEIEPVRPTLLYRLWILIVAFIMVLLPLIYAALVGLVIAGLVYHAVHDVGIFSAVGHGRHALQAALAVYLAPLIIGAVVVGFMLKPFFAKTAKAPKQRILDPSAEPLLHAFVDGVCSTVNSPRPARIAVNCDVNASAHREGGFLGLFGGELVLTIGLPLAAGLSLKQFSGVLAHEFGHFSQGAGMRLSVLIRKVNHWFARVVYERDEWDQTLEGWTQADTFWIQALGYLCKLAVWLTRRVLWLLMYVGHMASGFLSRQMEYDADRYEARMVGAQTFASTEWRLQELNLASQGAFADLQSSWHQRRLPDNFPKLVLANVPQIPPPMLEMYQQMMEQKRTGLFDTHPASRDRIANAEAEAPDDGLFPLQGPATDLFRDFDTLARNATFSYYRSLLGPQITKDQLFAVSELVESQAVTLEGHSAANRFFLGALAPTRRLPLPASYPEAPQNHPSTTKKALADSRSALQAHRDRALSSEAASNETTEQYTLAETALVLLKAGNKFSPSSFNLQSATPDCAETAKAQAQAALDEQDREYALFAQAAARRMALALALLELDAVRQRVSDGPARRDEARALYPCAALLGATVAPELASLVRTQSVLVHLVKTYQARPPAKAQELAGALLRAASSLRDALESLRWKVGPSLEYPFEHAREDISVNQFALPAITPDKEDLNGLLEASSEALERLVTLYRRALGRLAVTAEEVEKALGLPPLEFDSTEASPSS